MTEPLLPMLATASTGASGRNPVNLATLVESGDWTLDTKLDGVRAFLHPDGRIESRKGTDITYKFPEVANPTGLWLDGEIVALDNRFETALLRESQESTSKIALAAASHPCRFIAFDMPGLNGVAWFQRRILLEQVADMFDMPITPVSNDLAFFEQTRELGLEGVIAKRRFARYRFGTRSRDWVKFKHLHRVTCLLAGYTPGTGSREHFGALVLALIDETGDVVPVGRCGSGFTQKETHDLKARLDAGELLMAEIETVNLTSGGTLRFPVYRGLRTDVDLLSCTTGQLAALPRC